MNSLGFADPVFASQTAFRAILRATASPGEIVEAGADLAPPHGLSPAAAAVILTLVDFETPLWIAPSFPGHAEVAAYLKFHTGAPFAASPGKTAFALVDAGMEPFALRDFGQGSPEYPDRSTTLIAQVHALDGGPALRLTGPGVKRSRAIAPRPLPPDFLAQWSDNHAGFPLGVDLILCADREIAALPRGLRITGDA